MSARYIGNQFEISLNTSTAITLPAALAAQNYTCPGLTINSTIILTNNTVVGNVSVGGGPINLKLQARAGNISYTHSGNAPVSGSHGFIMTTRDITQFSGNLSALQFIGEGANATLTGQFHRP